MNADDFSQDVWKRNEADLPHSLAADQICAMARRRDREAVVARRLALFALAGLAGAFIHNTWILPPSWAKAGQGWMVVVMTVYLWGAIRSRTGRRASDETCVGFLLRGYEVKRNGYLAARRLVLWMIPGVLASWLDHGVSLQVRTTGLDPSSAGYRYLTSGWPTVATWALMILLWLAFSSAAKKAAGEFEALRQRIASAL
ncbi:MAG TPA: hypothetical protein VGM43_01530 [Bryobacteraceae bacterium]|jgi:hypothetical protein